MNDICPHCKSSNTTRHEMPHRGESDRYVMVRCHGCHKASYAMATVLEIPDDKPRPQVIKTQDARWVPKEGMWVSPNDNASCKYLLFELPSGTWALHVKVAPANVPKNQIIHESKSCLLRKYHPCDYQPNAKPPTTWTPKEGMYVPRRACTFNVAAQPKASWVPCDGQEVQHYKDGDTYQAWILANGNWALSRIGDSMAVSHHVTHAGLLSDYKPCSKEDRAAPPSDADLPPACITKELDAASGREVKVSRRQNDRDAPMQRSHLDGVPIGSRWVWAGDCHPESVQHEVVAICGEGPDAMVAFHHFSKKLSRLHKLLRRFQ